MSHTLELAGVVIFVLAVLHTFSAGYFAKKGHHYPEGSMANNFYHLIGDVEVVFYVWAFMLFIVMSIGGSLHEAVEYVEGLDYTEPMFVFVIMAMAATRPVLVFVTKVMELISKAIPGPKNGTFFITVMILGPLMGSFITEPAAMTVCALILKEKYMDHDLPQSLKYWILGTLFVNISIGGVLTHYAAPPVLMVAKTWGWDTSFMINNFGWKAVIAVTINTMVLAKYAWAKINEIDNSSSEDKDTQAAPPVWLIILHLVMIAGVVFFSHHIPQFMALLLLFLGVTYITKEYQSKLKLKESMMVGMFLAGLVTIGGMQKWWLQPVLEGMPDLSLFLGSTGLTAIFDNAALTYLGSLVEGLSESAKYALVAGAVAGGGLTVIANAPNPAGFALLKSCFGKDGINPGKLFLGALFPTIIVMLCFWFF